MGTGYTKEDENIDLSELFTTAQSSGIFPDIDIDESLRKYSGLDSGDVLRAYTSQLQTDVLEKAPDYIADLGSSIASLNGVPNAVGLGALIISLVLDLAIRSVSRESDGSTLNMLRRVFAEEKASSVRDTMDECMKRLSMHVREPSVVLEEMKRIEKQLSDQLTRLRNSMLHDNQMSSRSMKYWVNGAAFHSQMLIHAARLEARIDRKDSGNKVGAISTVVDHYLNDLQELLKKYKTYKCSTITLGAPPCILYSACTYPCIIEDNELNRKAVTSRSNDVFDSHRRCKHLRDAYVNYMFNTWDLLKKLEKYFSDLKKNTKELILQHQQFTMKNS